jgi:hypothetical protein
MTNYLIRIIAIVALMLSMNVAAQVLPIRVLVYGTHEGSNIVYHYKVINNGDVALHQFIIGNAVDNEDPDGYPQLERLPLGWTYGREGETGTEILLAPTSTSQPPYWKPSICGKQEMSNNCLEWEIAPDGLAYVISPGQSLAGFIVTVPLFDNELTPHDYFNAAQVVGEQDDIYLTGSFKVSYWDASKNNLKNIWGPIEIADRTPPTLSVTLSPSKLWPLNEKMVPVTAAITVTDDYDPNPEINLVSISCNEPMDKHDIKVGKLFTDIRQFQLKAGREGKKKTDRIYTVTYVAIDGSGNQTTASATVTVPHDRNEHEEHRDDKDKKKDKDEHKRDR